ncbi:hypothetical protein IT072_21085 (plasmid) [Leifsonia sp. ZF2019]|uniref:hypothetical protein n=1 Tax=Leifsonia sp. ZF2019 TaxID=2781978 RepID=UPI001CBB2384|nr:hypothetical protein [Leifsonia sp. ZF2019]UAJ81749.1 hypothetical protein IT072_21085 [Leifsonia sp. ZF2019]
MTVSVLVNITIHNATLPPGQDPGRPAEEDSRNRWLGRLWNLLITTVASALGIATAALMGFPG